MPRQAASCFHPSRLLAAGGRDSIRQNLFCDANLLLQTTYVTILQPYSFYVILRVLHVLLNRWVGASFRCGFGRLLIFVVEIAYA